jgi:hypothetical protein
MGATDGGERGQDAVGRWHDRLAENRAAIGAPASPSRMWRTDQNPSHCLCVAVAHAGLEDVRVSSSGGRVLVRDAHREAQVCLDQLPPSRVQGAARPAAVNSGASSPVGVESNRPAALKMEYSRNPSPSRPRRRAAYWASSGLHPSAM